MAISDYIKIENFNAFRSSIDSCQRRKKKKKKAPLGTLAVKQSKSRALMGLQTRETQVPQSESHHWGKWTETLKVKTTKKVRKLSVLMGWWVTAPVIFV